MVEKRGGGKKASWNVEVRIQVRVVVRSGG